MWDELPNVSSIFNDYINDIQQLFVISDIIDDSNTYLEFRKDILKQSKRKNYISQSSKKIKKTGLNNLGVFSHPLKASICLSIYSFIEAISTNMMLDIHKKYIESFDRGEIVNLKNWNEKIIKAIISHNENHQKKENPLEMHLLYNIDDYFIKKWLEDYREDNFKSNGPYKWFNGNVTCYEINRVLIEKNGIKFNNYGILKSKNDRNRIINEAKENRNKLAHGGITFTEYGRTRSTLTMRKDFFEVKGFMYGILNIVNKNLKTSFYLNNSEMIDQ